MESGRLFFGFFILLSNKGLLISNPHPIITTTSDDLWTSQETKASLDLAAVSGESLKMNDDNNDQVDTQVEEVAETSDPGDRSKLPSSHNYVDTSSEIQTQLPLSTQRASNDPERDQGSKNDGYYPTDAENVFKGETVTNSFNSVVDTNLNDSVVDSSFIFEKEFPIPENNTGISSNAIEVNYTQVYDFSLGRNRTKKMDELISHDQPLLNDTLLESSPVHNGSLYISSSSSKLSSLTSTTSSQSDSFGQSTSHSSVQTAQAASENLDTKNASALPDDLDADTSRTSDLYYYYDELEDLPQYDNHNSHSEADYVGDEINAFPKVEDDDEYYYDDYIDKDEHHLEDEYYGDFDHNREDIGVLETVDGDYDYEEMSVSAKKCADIEDSADDDDDGDDDGDNDYKNEDDDRLEFQVTDEHDGHTVNKLENDFDDVSFNIPQQDESEPLLHGMQMVQSPMRKPAKSIGHIDYEFGPNRMESELTAEDWIKLSKGEPVVIHPHHREKNNDDKLGIIVFYSWIALVSIMIIGAVIAVRHKHRVNAIANYVMETRGGYKETVFATEEGRNLLNNQQM